ncbi:MAG: DNA mismatch repair endonuclease MutL [Nitrospiraceae bacterium]|nr:DNA mismatch repair endonuclease MutL [Nitrospiraceae bacterium]
MPQIKILSVDLRNKIAAGEVIERPASVVKELIENSIDAESTDIRIEILHGGKKMIKVSDNGIGMDKDDAVLCFEQYATSKIRDESDLFNITTMGFRGEALPSIASVSKIKLVTGLKEAVSGFSIELHGGELKSKKDSPSSGTSIEIKDLFFNTPARKKFLKTNTTELYHIIDTVTKEALSHPEIGFTLVTDNQETIVLSKASGLRERVMQIYGDELMAGLVEVNLNYNSLNMSAFISKTENFRSSKAHQFIFVNDRPIKDYSISHAVYNAYEGILPKDKHPVFFIFLDINPKIVDFNVHPTKKEVRFENKEAVYNFINAGIKDVIKEKRVEYTRQFTEEMSRPGHQQNYSKQSFINTAPVISENLELAYKPSIPFVYLGDTFVAMSGKGGLTLIDHHAAHERIMYEKFLKKINLSSHQLLFPKQIKLSAKEYKIILENENLLDEFGIDIDDFGHDTIIIRSLPDELMNSDIRGILSDIASSLIEGLSPERSLKEKIAASIACHSSVRGKEILNQEEFSSLIADLDKTDFPDQCPHGRPTRIFFSLDDLKKFFKRK